MIGAAVRFWWPGAPRIAASRCLLSLLFLSNVAWAAGPGPGAVSIDELLTRARSERLAERIGWIRLGHWYPRLFGGYQSQADGPEFFLAPDGKSDPAAELEATLRAFFSPVLPEHAHPDREHPLCRFPARQAWLVKALGIDEAQLPKPRCLKLDAFVERVSAKSATLSFSSYYLAQPSSVFGHIFLRLNKDQQTPDGREKELLDWGFNYGGAIDTNNPVVYAIKGLTGAYQGTFLHLPYFYKVREYNDYESRDVWEYRLALEPDEVELLVLHLWEVGHTWFDYYYLDENCAWHLLAVLEAAAPRLSLVEHLKATALPGDAIHALYENTGLISSFKYRPSLRTQFELRARELDGEAIRTVRALEKAPNTEIAGDAATQAAVLDAAMDYLDLRNAKAIAFHTSPEIEERRHRLMVRRSRLRAPSAELGNEPPLEEAPHLAHGSRRLGVGAGVSRNGGPFARLTWRLLLHDLLDPPDGYPRHTRMEVLPLELRYDLQQRRLHLEQLDLIRIEHLPPFTRYGSDVAYGIRLGAGTVRDGGCDACLVGRLETVTGASVQPFHRGLLYALAVVSVEAGPELSGLLGSAVRPSAGARAGLRWHVTPWWSTMLGGEGWAHGEDRLRPSWSASFANRLHLGSHFSLDLEVRRIESGPEFAATALFYH